jgi:hypothetical protein
MGRRILKLAVRAASAAAKTWTAISKSLPREIMAPPKTYQPERYSMRGPGPACRDKDVLDRVTRRTWCPAALL